MVLDGSEAPVRIDAETLLSSEKLAPAAFLNKVKLLPTVQFVPCWGGGLCSCICF